MTSVVGAGERAARLNVFAQPRPRCTLRTNGGGGVTSRPGPARPSPPSGLARTPVRPPGGGALTGDLARPRSGHFKGAHVLTLFRLQCEMPCFQMFYHTSRRRGTMSSPDLAAAALRPTRSDGVGARGPQTSRIYKCIYIYMCIYIDMFT